MSNKWLCISISLMIFLSGCQTGNKKNEDKKKGVDSDIIQNPEGKKNKLAEFSFEKEEHDFGKVVKGEKVSYTFKFTNTGNQPLVISSANASCGCTVPNYPKEPVEPGESGLIDVVFDSEGKSGTFNKSVTLIANTGKGPKKIYIKGQIVNKR